MGDGVLSSNVVNSEASEKRDQVEVDNIGGGGAAFESMMRWERFLPRMVMRVLLVEADDSTRQIIAALLRKCSYRVDAVPDGLKAWEILKEKPRNIDLILMEIDLPSISGFALLTLIMEHEICRTIPIIMMSSQDSMSMVYKCMMRGAADFLMKPVRKNELKNLWQHVWRRRTINCGGYGPPAESVAEQIVDAGSESKDASNDSSCYITSNQRNKELVEKLSDVQSSFTKPDLQADEMCPVNIHELPKSREHFLSNKKLQTLDGVEVAASKNTMIITEEKDEAPNNLISASHSKEAIDLIGAFDNCSKTIYKNSCFNNYTDRVEDYSMLDLSLRRSCASEKDRRLDSSPFSRYANKTSIASTSHPNEDHESQISNHIKYWKNTVVVAPQKAIFSGSVSFRGERLNDLTHPYEQSNIQRRNSQEACSSKPTTDQQQANNSKNRTETEETPSTNQNRILQRSVQREEALNKFRLKRKDRCYKKKVRYESRKKLAENRPRVKGQFVRKVQTAPQGNSLDES
ncbi:two-component response regulator-like PRR95 [Impatiens glandulifera]|uniref:two-component response regulator-like PRR95 n=1 Tax=Impatiens glandulifera TaxID=253017 RepID=UPI001FB0E9FB|nr:two-component response regulator-like PRR95 [Impatiens glandulifera]